MASPRPVDFGVLIAGVVEPVEGPEYMLALILGDAGPVVLDLNHQRAVFAARR